MDNREDLPGYKYYVDASTRRRPAVYVAFVDLAEEKNATVDGVVFSVGDDQLKALDARERNYRRRDVTAQITPPTGGTTYTYVGTPEARRRFEAGRAANSLVVARAYLASLPPSTEPPALPIRDLERVDLLPLDGAASDAVLAKPRRKP